MRIIASLFAAFAVLFSAPAMAAEWYVVDTKHFTVYTKDTKKNAEEYGKELERVDEALRIISGVGPSDDDFPASSKVTVFRFGETSDMGKLLGRRGVGGFFRGDAVGSVAFAPRRDDVRRERGFERTAGDIPINPKYIVFHEYTHYFMFHHRDAPYPLWYSEGFAELFGTMTFEKDRFVIGDVPPERSIALKVVDLDLEEMFAPGEEPSREYTSRVYAHGWLLASLLNLTPERRSQIGPYLMAINEGVDPLEAAKNAFGDLDVLEKELDDYRGGAAKVLKVPFLTKQDPEVSVRRMTEAEEARMDVLIRAKAGVDEDQAKKQVDPARDLVSRYPESVPVLLTAVEAEFDAKNWNEAESLAERILAIDPDNVDAAIYYARVALMRGYEDKSQIAVARERFAKANNLQPDHAYPLYGYYLSFLYSDETPPDDAIASLERAFVLARYDNSIRNTLAYRLAKEERYSVSQGLLRRTLIGAGKYPRELSACYTLAEAGDNELLLDMLRPDHPMDESEKEWDDKSDEEKWPCLTKVEATA